MPAGKPVAKITRVDAKTPFGSCTKGDFKSLKSIRIGALQFSGMGSAESCLISQRWRKYCETVQIRQPKIQLQPKAVDRCDPMEYRRKTL